MDSEEISSQGWQQLKLIAGVIVFFGLWLAPLPFPPEQHRLVAVLALVFLYWVTEALPLPATALLGVTLCVMLGVMPAKSAFASFGNPILFLFVGAFMLAEAVRVHELDRRLVETLLTHPFFTRTPFRVVAGFALAAWSISAWMSNTATTATLYPLAWQTHQNVRAKLTKAAGFGAALMLTCAFTSSIGGILTPVGTPPNLIGLGFLREQTKADLSFLQWMLIAIPIGFVMLLVHLLVARQMFGLSKEPVRVQVQPERRGSPLRPGERNTLLAFGLAISLWVVSGLVPLVLGQESAAAKWLETRLPEAVPALLGALLLFILPLDRAWGRGTLSWKEAHRIDWGVILLFGGGLALGDAIFATGLAKRIGEAVSYLPYADTLWGLTAWGTALAVLFTEIVSNTAAVNMLVPLTIATAQQADVSVIPPVLGVTIGCSLGFMMPMGTPPNAIVYSSGLVPILIMIRLGVVLDVASILSIWLLLRLLCPLFGLV